MSCDKAALRTLLLLLFALLPAAFAEAADTDVVINEVFYLGGVTEDWVELKNTGSEIIDVSTWLLCSQFTYPQLSSLTLLTGDDLILEPGIIVTVAAGMNLHNTAADLGLYKTGDFTSPTAMVDFVQWGTSEEDIGRAAVAAAKGIWLNLAPNTTDFVETAAAGQSVTYCGTNGGGDLLTLSTDFRNTGPTQGLENGDPCNLIFTDGFESGDVTRWSASVP